jgi:chitin disaccharide deacetylase
MDATRYLVVVADDYGIGPETSRAILELARRGVLGGAVLLVNSPYAADAVRAWRASGVTAELGWHPCLSMDPPCAPAARVPTLIGTNGCLWPLGAFLTRLHSWRIRAAEIAAELEAQFDYFVTLVGRPPALVNAHQHVALFPPVGAILERLLKRRCPTPPYVRRVREPWALLARVPGARPKRALLNVLGRRQGRRLDRAGFPGNDWLAGVTDPKWVTDPAYFRRWLAAVPGHVVELCCHPGHHDPTLVGRDCRSADDPLLRRRVDEMRLLGDPDFPLAVRDAGFVPIPPSDLRRRRGLPHAA